MILLIDNYDSFVYNLARYFSQLGQSTRVVRNDEFGVEQIERLGPAAIVISPGPCGPPQAGCSLEVVRQLHERIPILGVCLGHQTIAAAFGAGLLRDPTPWHGRASMIHHDGRGIFQGLPDPLMVGRYHSLTVSAEPFPAELEVTAWSHDHQVMALRHRSSLAVGVQFHPESILTVGGYLVLANFLRLAGLPVSDPECKLTSFAAASPPAAGKLEGAGPAPVVTF